MKSYRYILAAGCGAWLICLNACSLAPEFHPPKIDVPQAYKEDQGKWLAASPQMADKDRGPWWTAYKDEDLNGLEEKIASSNQDLKAALARYDQARAIAADARSGYFPQVTLQSAVQREGTSQTIAEVRAIKPFNDFLAGADLSYEIDIWGKVRNAAKSAEKQAVASAADLATMDLGLHAELALDYFALRGDDDLQVLLDQTVKAYEKALKLTEARHAGGIAPELDVDQAKTQLQSAKTYAADNHLKRAQLEHAIAVLIGIPPSAYSLAPKTITVAIPVVAPGMPSGLIERRPDIAAASLRMESANADIGVARAAYYPDFSLSGSGGFESAVLPTLLTKPSLFWAIGPMAMMPLLDGGKVNALNARARAAYDESVANYRQTVLAAYQQVEDNLVSLHQLEEEDTTQTAAATAAKRAQKQVEDRYKGGIATYLDVVILENTALQAQMSEINIHVRRLTANILLTKALGGGWQESSLHPAMPPITPSSLLLPVSSAH
jgi:NodT family efflux transporter outer membrane factor (OMF) lipoprotein